MIEYAMLAVVWTFLVVLVTASYVSDREWKKHLHSYFEKDRADRESCNRFRLAVDAFTDDLGPLSFQLIFSDHIFIAWQRGNHYIDLRWDRGGDTPVKASLRIDQCKQELTVDDDLAHVLTVMRRWAAEHGMLRSQSVTATGAAGV